MPQVQIESKFIAVHQNTFDSLGIDFSQSTTVLVDDGIPEGAYSEDTRDVVLASAVLGGDSDTQYLVPGSQPADGFVGYINPDLIPHFLSTQIFVQLPLTTGCVNFKESDITLPQNFGGLADHTNLIPVDQGYGGGLIHYIKPEPAAVDSLLSTLQGSSLHAVMRLPQITLHDSQRGLIMVNDYQPDTDDLTPAFSTAISMVTAEPFRIFTGPLLDIISVINSDGSVDLEIRFGTRALSFYYSTAFTVGSKSADLNVPEVQSGTNSIKINLSDGEAVLLGGFTPSGSSVMNNGVPGLSDIPLLGSLFTGTNFNDVNQKLMIYIAPQIIATD